MTVKELYEMFKKNGKVIMEYSTDPSQKWVILPHTAQYQ